MEGDRENSTATDQLEKELRRLRANFLNKLPGRLQALVEEWNALQGDGWSQDGARALHRSVHGLIGTAGSLGFSKMAKTARRLERRLVAMLEGKQPPTPEVSAEVIEWYERMGEDATAHAQQAVDPSSFENVAEWGAPIFEPRNLIVVVEQEDPFARELAHQLGHFGFELQMFKKIDDLVADGVERRPAAVIMDLSSPEGDLLGEEVATKVRDELGDDVPLVFVSNRSDIEARLDAVRSGCNSYFVKPVNYSDVLETLDRLTRSEPEPYRILIVDDEPDTAEFHSTNLEMAGLETVTVTDPLEVMSQLVEFQPDVILMDVYMPGCSGLELAMVIRQEETFVGVPIVFLSRETDRMKQIGPAGPHAAFVHGKGWSHRPLQTQPNHRTARGCGAESRSPERSARRRDVGHRWLQGGQRRTRAPCGRSGIEGPRLSPSPAASDERCARAIRRRRIHRRSA
jgi:DNA-binding response OmpR family regulator/HPt (histidine-containing phosphotransfer) domain-containing protein